MIVAVYCFWDNYEKIHSKSILMGIGALVILLAILNVILGGYRIFCGKESSRNQQKIIKPLSKQSKSITTFTHPSKRIQLHGKNLDNSSDLRKEYTKELNSKK